MNILLNRIRCKICGEILISRHRHDYQCCPHSFVDGGHDYVRYGGEGENISIWDNGEHKLRRNTLEWGKNYTKDNIRLPKTEYIKICDMEDEHIEKVLELFGDRLPKVYLQTFLDEITFREEQTLKEYDEVFKHCPEQNDIFKTDL